MKHEAFLLGSGTRQGYLLSPTPFQNQAESPSKFNKVGRKKVTKDILIGKEEIKLCSQMTQPSLQNPRESIIKNSWH